MVTATRLSIESGAGYRLYARAMATASCRSRPQTMVQQFKWWIFGRMAVCSQPVMRATGAAAWSGGQEVDDVVSMGLFLSAWWFVLVFHSFHVCSCLVLYDGLDPLFVEGGVAGVLLLCFVLCPITRV